MDKIKTDQEKIPVLFLIFNRKDIIVEAMNAIKKYQPAKIYIAADGPRKNKVGESEACNNTRQATLDMIDWDCEIKTLFRDENLGCAKAVNGALNWFFDNEEYGIIIEDDVVVGKDFFKFCEVLLPRYKNDSRIMEISAMNYGSRKDNQVSYVYSQCFHCWGWATWKRAWKRMDMSMEYFNKISISYLTKRLGIFRGIMMYQYFKKGYQNIDTFNSWATRWYLSIIYYDGLVICPIKNLVKNIGFSAGAHYDVNDTNRIESSLKIENLKWPLIYNDSCIIDSKQKKIDSIFFMKQKLEGIQKKLRCIIR